MTLRKNITYKPWAISFMAITLLIAVTLVYAPLASAGNTLCPADLPVAPFVGNIEVDGTCTSNSELLQGNVILDTAGDSFDLASVGEMIGNIDAENCSGGADPYGVKVSAEAVIFGNVNGKNCTDPVLINGRVVSGNVQVENGDLSIGLSGLVSGNVQVENGDLSIGPFALVLGNVKHVGPGDLTLEFETRIDGNIECDGTTTFTDNGAIFDPDKLKCP